MQELHRSSKERKKRREDTIIAKLKIRLVIERRQDHVIGYIGEITDLTMEEAQAAYDEMLSKTREVKARLKGPEPDAETEQEQDGAPEEEGPGEGHQEEEGTEPKAETETE